MNMHSTEKSQAGQKIDLNAIMTEARHYLLDDHALKAELMAKIDAAFFEGAEKFAGPAARKGLERDGLRNIHKHFPVEKIRLLEHYIMERLRDDLYYWSFRVGRDTLGIKNEFYVDHLIVIRIHYPHLVARKARADAIEAPPYPLTERMRLGLAALRNPKMLAYAGGRAIAKKIEARRATKAHAYDAKKTHGNLATPARAHGAHVDTWYGHSYDGVNLWLSIDGVNEGNTVILYPEMWGQEVHFNPVSMYLAEGQATPKPLKYRMDPGQLLVLNPEMLHGTQVNISDETRVALTTRLNPHEPRFAPEAPFHFEYWYSSVDLEKKRWGKMSAFPHKEYLGKPSWVAHAPYQHPNEKRATFDVALERGAAVDVGAVTDLAQGIRYIVDLQNVSAMIWNTPEGLRAYSRKCPHMAIDLADGYHDGKDVYCPGHGMSFDIASGDSSCVAFKLRQFVVTEENGRMMLSRGAAEA